MNVVVFYILIGVLAGCVGSFINMAAYRIPKQLYFSWFIECYNFLQLNPKISKTPKLNLNLFYPHSHCPNCKQKVYFWDNIPIISYLILKAKCRNCKILIPISYLLTEIITTLTSIIVAYKFGINYKLIFALLFTWTLILQALIDFKEYIIPDEITLPILWLGLIINKFEVFTDLTSAVFGAIAGYLVFWIVYWVFKIVTGKEGLGYGDFKLLAMLGAWLGYNKLLFIIMLASTIGSIVGIGMIIYFKHDHNKPLSFGPYLAIAGWTTLLCGNSIYSWYLQYFTV